MTIVGAIRTVTVPSCRRALFSLHFVAFRANNFTPRRPFSTSQLSQTRQSQVSCSPRWINPKHAQDITAKRPSDAPKDDKGVAEDEQVSLGDNSQDDNGSPPSSTAGSPPSSSSSGNNPSDSSDPPAAPPPESPPPSQGSIAKQSVPDVYPQVLALPIARRPLFPGFYKAVVVRDPAVVAAIKEMMKRGQPYLGAFLLKEDTDSDVITDINSVHRVGVFAQITSVFTASGKDDDKDEGLTAVLYPHRRIKITELLKAGESVPPNQPPEKSDQPVTPPPSPQAEVAQVHPGTFLLLATFTLWVDSYSQVPCRPLSCTSTPFPSYKLTIS